MARARGTLRRPIEMTKRGQGGASGEFDSEAVIRPLAGTRCWKRVGIRAIGPMGFTRFRL
jgi:hypothetical protein